MKRHQYKELLKNLLAIAAVMTLISLLPVFIWAVGPNTYFVANGGAALTKEAATSGTYPGGCMSVTVHNGENFAPGDTIVVIDAGGVYKAIITPPSSGSAGNLITYQASGSPVVDCADTYSGAWTIYGAGPAYSTTSTISPALDSSVPTWNSMWENGTRMVRATSAANCAATANSYYPTSDTTAPITMYIHASDGSDLNSNGKLYEYASRSFGFNGNGASAQYVKIDGLVSNGFTFKRNLGLGGSIYLGANCQAFNCTALEGNSHNVICKEGCYLYNIKASKAYYTSGGQFFTYNDNSPSGGNVTFDTCSVDNNGVYNSLYGGFYGHVNVSGNYGTITYTNCSVSDCNQVYLGRNSQYQQSDNCHQSGGQQWRYSGHSIGQ